MPGLFDYPADHRDCPACKRLRSGLSWVGDPFDPDQWPRCPRHRKRHFPEVWQ